MAADPQQRGSESSSNYWCGFPLWILLVLWRKPTEEAQRALKDLERRGKRAAQIPETGINQGAGAAEMEQGRDQLCAPRSYPLGDSVKRVQDTSVTSPQGD